MEDAGVPISELTTQKQRVWTLHCRVSRKWTSINPNKDTVLNMGLIAIDNRENDIWVLIPYGLVRRFDHQLKEQKYYVFNNFNVQLTANNYRPVPNLLMIEFNEGKTMQEIEDVPGSIPYIFRFITAKDIPRKLNVIWNLSDVVGHLEEMAVPLTMKSSFNKTPRQYIKLLLIEGPSVRVVLWGRIVTQLDEIVKSRGNASSTLVITSVYVRVYEGEYYLSSSTATRVYANLSIPEVAAIEAMKGELNPPQLVPEPQPVEIPSVTIEELNALRLQDGDKKTLELNSTVTKIQDKWFYQGCGATNCRRAVLENSDGFFCGVCLVTSKQTVRRFRIVITVTDHTGDTDLVFLDHEASKYLGVSAQELFNSPETEDGSPPSQVMRILGLKRKLHVKITDYDRKKPSSKLNILRIIEELEMTSAATDKLCDKEANQDGLNSGHSSSASITTTASPSQVSPHDSPDEDNEAGRATDVEDNTSGTPSMDLTAISMKRRRVVMDD